MSCEYANIIFSTITTSADLTTVSTVTVADVKGQLELSSYRPIDTSTFTGETKFYNFFPTNYCTSGVIIKGMSANDGTYSYIVENIEEYSDHLEIILRLEAA